MASAAHDSDRPVSAPDFQLLIDSAPALIHTGLPDGYLDFFNQSWLEYVGRPLDDLTGWKWTTAIHPDDVEGIVSVWRASLASGRPFLYEARVRRADGEYRWMLHHKVAIRDEHGKIIKWNGSSIDIQDRKTAEEQVRRKSQDLQRSEFYLAEGQRLAHMGSWALDPGGFYYWSPELFRMYGLDPAGKPPDVQQYLDCVHPRDRQFMADLISGILAKASPFDATKRIVRPNGDVRYIRCVGVPLAEDPNLKRFVGSALDVTEQELLTQELRRREAYLTEAQRLSHTGSFGWKPDTGEIAWSEETHRIFEYDPAEKATISTVLQRTHPQDRALVQQVIERASKTGTEFEHEYRLLLPGGAIKHVRAVAQPFHDASGNLEFVGAVSDISEQRRAEALSREREAELREVVDTIPALVWSALPDGSNVYVNKRFAEYMGASPEETTGSGWQALVHSDDLERHVGKWMDAVTTGEPHESEVRCRRSDGQYRWQLDRGVPLRDDDGNIVKWYGVTADIEDRKQAEDKIREQEAELRQMLDLTPQIVAVYGPNSERLYANRVALDYIGLSLEEWQQGSDRGVYFHPDDRKRVLDAFDRAFSTGSAEEMELRLRKGDGTYRWFFTRCIPFRDEKGHIKRFYSASIDIDDRKKAEERLQQENVALREEIDKASMFEEIVGTSPVLQKVLSRISKVGPTDSTVLLTGETGTGKELIARAIHRRSQRSSRSFVSVNCAAVPRDLIASELFGHEKGAFTGALQRRLGRFELAQGGTIFLDEVGELPTETQVALLRVLQEREFERVGGNQLIRADVRVIAATNRDLEAAIGAGSFRRDLFYRLSVFPIESPPLRERKEDIPMLVEYFIDRYARNLGKRIRNVEKSTMQLLSAYSWPGNIRELQNVIERSVILCEGDTISVDPSWLSVDSAQARQMSQRFGKKTLQEKDVIEAALAKSGGRVSGPSGAAAALRIPASTLESKIRSLGIDKFRFKYSSH